MHSGQFDLSTAFGLHLANLFELVTATDDGLEAHLAPLTAENDEASSLHRHPAGSAVDGQGGWSLHAWARELRRRADRCDSLHPSVARTYREWAAAVETPHTSPLRPPE